MSEARQIELLERIAATLDRMAAGGEMIKCKHCGERVGLSHVCHVDAALAYNTTKEQQAAAYGPAANALPYRDDVRARLVEDACPVSHGDDPGRAFLTICIDCYETGIEAARARAFEEAARVCENEACGLDQGPIWVAAAQVCADKVRDLAAIADGGTRRAHDSTAKAP